MHIGIDGSRAFLKRRTGIEEYAYQVIASLRSELRSEEVTLYIRGDQSVSFEVPKNWRIKKLRALRFWTQVRLSLEMLLSPPDVLFVPAHIVPLIHPKRTVVTIHGLEYEIFKDSYSFLARLYMRYSIRFSCKAASRIVAVSESTKRDLMRLYGIRGNKIEVIYEGISASLIDQPLPVTPHSAFLGEGTREAKKPYLLFIGRLEERKNIVRIIKMFEILKREHGIPHTLKLAGKPGFGYGKIQEALRGGGREIEELGYVHEEEKGDLMKNADIFLFPTLYEGFGLPVLEAQALGVPVITSLTSSLPEIAGGGALFVDPLRPTDMAEKTWRLISEKVLRDDIIAKGHENARRFSWERCAESLSRVLGK